MVDYENPPPPGGVSPKSGKWDKSGVAPKWLPHKWYEPYKDKFVSAVIGGVVGALVALFTSSIIASRSESFQLEQTQRESVQTVRANINVMLSAVDQRDDMELGKAIQQLEISSLYLPAYRDLLRPLFMAVTGKQTELTSYQILTINPETNERNVDESKLAEINSVGWREISWEALKVRCRLIASPGPITLKGNSELCDSM